ncbi:hypothetical protein SLS55_007880 [Diplodia seriata]|uniref:NmrA-like domain-containing protein n=1 Tax=Diplodia seriata TaxID=420778 RepID=A0ABR3CA79_9PEZI
MSKTLLITGATGKQGGAVIKALLAANADFNILAVTRDSSSDSAKALEKQSAKIKAVQGDLNDPEAIFTAAGSPIWGVFSVQLPGSEEEAQGNALVDAALAHGVQHFVFTSVERGTPRPNVPTNVPHFASKHRIEEHLLAKAGDRMTWTVIQPVAFLDNYSGYAPQFAAAFAAMWKGYLGEEKKLQVIATTDIGKVAARSFVQPEKYAGRKISLAGDVLSLSDVRRIFKEKTGKEIPEAPEQVGKGIVEGNADLKAMWTWFNTDSFGADVPALRKEFPDLMDYGTWLVKEGGYNAQ